MGSNNRRRRYAFDKRILLHLALKGQSHKYALMNELSETSELLKFNTINRPMLRLKEKKYIELGDKIKGKARARQNYMLTTKGLIAAIGSFYWFDEWHSLITNENDKRILLNNRGQLPWIESNWNTLTKHNPELASHVLHAAALPFLLDWDGDPRRKVLPDEMDDEELVALYEDAFIEAVDVTTGRELLEDIEHSQYWLEVFASDDGLYNLLKKKIRSKKEEEIAKYDRWASALESARTEVHGIIANNGSAH